MENLNHWQYQSRHRRIEYRNILPFHRKSPSKEEKKDNDLQANLETGIKFEKFVVPRFNIDYFTLLEWRSDKEIDGIFPFTSIFPDLEFYFQSLSESFYFAVECKWRAGFYKDCIEFKNYQLENYLRFEAITNTPTFIILGVGGKPDRPEEMYVTPLREMQSSMHSMTLLPYKRSNPFEPFFLNCSKITLR